VDYAVRRTKEHLLRFHRLYEQIKAGRVDEGFLGHCEGKDNLFPFLNWRHWA
jgi:1,4-alpha-glucan branching enzyme